VLARLQKRRREETGPAGMGGALCIDPEAASSKLQAASFKLDSWSRI